MTQGWKTSQIKTV